MDRDSRENIVDPVERVSPSNGDNDTCEVGEEEARILRERQIRKTEPEPKTKASDQ
jgi:hypothetical protein